MFMLFDSYLLFFRFVFLLRARVSCMRKRVTMPALVVGRVGSDSWALALTAQL